VRDLNPRHPACKAGALPTELTVLGALYPTVYGRDSAGVLVILF
jgi:hypothetical protein